jgi:Amt family ammonium transporter
MIHFGFRALFVLFGALALSSELAFANVDSGDTAWVLASSALVLLMTPGLALFYGGMVRTRHALSTMYQSFLAIGVCAVVWAVLGYSFAFGPDMAGGLIGGFDYTFLNGVGQQPQDGSTIPHVAFVVFQCMFAIITPALITGAFAERVRTAAWIPVMALWSLFIYSPICHWVWGPGGWVSGMGGLDFAGGLVVHMSAGFSALAAAIVLGKRRDFQKTEEHVYSPGLILLGTGLLLFGWFGFNGGSALASNGLAAHAFATTLLAAATGTIGWTLVDKLQKGHASPMGSAIGCVVGLVVITPAAGFVSLGVALGLGLFAGAVCNFVAGIVKARFQADDTLDVFACHGVGGLIGVVATGLFASTEVNPSGANGLFNGESGLLVANLQGAVAVAVFSLVGTVVILKVVGQFTRVRAEDQDEMNGLDDSQYAEFADYQASLPPRSGADNTVAPLRKAS